MESIRTYTDRIYLCTSCGQPCHKGAPGDEYGTLLVHFEEQWDGIYCALFPLADKPIEVDWLPQSLEDLKAKYPAGSRASAAAS